MGKMDCTVIDADCGEYPGMKYKVILTATSLLMLNGCYGCPPTILSRECREFFAMPSKEQEARFRAYSVDKQVDLYLCGMNREPPEIAYAAYIAEGGEKNIPYLLRRLEAEQLEITQLHVIDIFTMLAVKGHLRGRQDVIAQLDQVVSRMKYEPIRLKARAYLDEIKTDVQ
jgi:hypothetical protein